MEYLYGVLSSISRDLVCGVVKQLRYPCCFNNFVEELKKEEGNLIATRNSVKDRIAHAEQQTRRTAEVVDKWLENAEIDVNSVNTLLTEARTKNRCCFGHCPNWIFRYRLGKKLANKKEELEKFIKEGGQYVQLERVATLPSGILDSSSEKYLSFWSRQKAYEELMEAVKDDEVGMIELYGMGGCGKTTMAEKIMKIVEAEHLFDKVIFVTVSNTVQVGRIQDKIASSLQYTFPENEERERAKRLCTRLTQEKKILVILDDVWQKLDFDSIGIPSTEHHKGCKFLITTRSEAVCNSMDCKTIHLPILEDEEAWTLFQKEANINEDTSDTIKHLARQISNKCKGLPVAIAAVASTLKCKDKDTWKVALNRLKSSKRVHIEKGLQDPYKCLELSYHYLDHEEAKSLFLLCSVFPEDYEIPIELLTRCAIGLGVVREVHSYEEARSEVNAAKNKLVSSCLLMLVADDDDDDDDGERVKMHDLVRDVAHLIAKNENKLIKCEVENDVTLEQNSVRYLWCKKLPNDLDCSNLEFLCITTKVEVLDEIFTRMRQLRVLFLDNERWDERLPLSTKSFKTLTNLRCLILSQWKLSDISFVRDMKKLESLSLNECSLPSFLDLQKDDVVTQLTKLKLLVLRHCEMERNIFEVIGRIPRLEELCVIDKSEEWDDYSENTIEFFKSFSVPQTLQRYTIMLQSQYGDDDVELFAPPERTLLLSNFHIPNEAVMCLAKKAKTLGIGNIKGGAKNIIPNIFQLEEGGMPELNVLNIRDSKEIECLVDTSNHMSEVVGTLFSNLLDLSIRGVDDLRVLWHGCLPPRKLERLELRECPQLTSLFTQVITPNPVRYSIFQNLQEVMVYNCGELKYVFSANTVGGLPQLKSLDIWDCGKLDQIIEVSQMEIIPENTSTPSAPLVNHSSGSFTMSKLTSIDLRRCPKLGSLFPASIAKTLISLENLIIECCNGLKHLLTCERAHNSKKNDSVEDDHDLQSVISMSLSLKILDISKCDLLQHIFCVFFVGGQNDFEDNSCHLQHKNIQIGPQASLVLEELKLYYLPQMTCIWVASKNYFNLQYLKTLHIWSCAKLEVIFPLSVVRCLPELEHLEITECEELKQIMEEDVEDKKLSNIVSPQLCFPKLKQVLVTECHKLEVIFRVSVVRCLPELELLQIIECKELKQIMEEDVEDKKLSNIVSPQPCFPKLKEVLVIQCHKLEVIFRVSVVRCLPELELLKIEECKELKQIMEEDVEDKKLSNIISPQPCFLKLKTVIIIECHKLKRLFSTSTSNDLPNLEVLIIDKAAELEELIGFEQGASKNSFTLQYLKTLEIKRCAKLEVIFPMSIVRCLPELERLQIIECKELKQIMEEEDENDTIQRELKPCFPKLTVLRVQQCHMLKHLFSMSASNGLPNLEFLIITGADELEELIGCDQRNSEELGKSKVELPKLKLLILIHLSNLCQGIELCAAKHCIINNCPKLSLTSTTTLQEVLENIRADFENLGRDLFWDLNIWIYEITKSNEVSKRSGTSEFPSSQINKELHDTTSTSKNSELDERSSPSPLDIHRCETNIENIKIGIEAGTALENAMMVSSHLESTSSQSDSSKHKSYACQEVDSKPENTSPLQMNQEDPSTSKSESPASQVNDNNQSISGSIAEIVREHKQIQNEAPVSKTDEFLELEKKKERTSNLQLLEKKLSFFSFPNMKEKIEEIGTESPQEATESDRATIKTLLAGAESINSGGGVATSTGSSGRDILAQDSKVVEKVSTSEIPTVATSLTNSELVESSSPSYLDILLHKTHSNCLEEEMKDLSMQVGAKSEMRNSSPPSLLEEKPLQKNIKCVAEEGTISNNTNVAALSMHFESAISQSGQLVTSQSKSYPHSESESHPKNIEDLGANDIMSLFQPVAAKEHGEGQVATSSIVAGTADYQFTKDNRVVEVLAELEKCLKMPPRDIASSETCILHLLTALNFLSGLPFKDTTLCDGLKDIIDSMHKEFPSILCSFKQGFATTDKLTVLEAHQNEVDVTLVSKISEAENLIYEAQHKEAVLKERVIRLKKEINDCEAALSSLQEENKKRGAETIGYKKELESVRKDKSQMVEDQRKVEQELFEVAYKWSVLCSKFELNRIVGRNPS